MTKISSPVAGTYVNTPNQMEAVKVLSDVFKFQIAPKKNAKQKRASENPVGTNKEKVFDPGNSKVQTRNGISKSTVKPVRINIPDTYRPYPAAPSRGPTMACDGSGIPPVEMPTIKLKESRTLPVEMPTPKLQGNGPGPVPMPTACFEGGKLKPIYRPSDKPASRTGEGFNIFPKETAVKALYPVVTGPSTAYPTRILFDKTSSGQLKTNQIDKSPLNEKSNAEGSLQITQKPIWPVKTNRSGNTSIFGDTFKPGATRGTGNILPAKPTSENITPTNPKGGTTPPAVSQNGHPPATISVAQLRDINKNVQISDTSPFVVTDNLKKMFEGSGFVKEDDATTALVTIKPISLGNGISLPAGTKITNSIDQRSTGRGGLINDMGVPENLQFTTPNGSSIKFSAGRDRKSGLETTVMEMTGKNSDNVKSVTFLGTPIFNAKTGVLMAAAHFPGSSGKTNIYDGLMDRINTSLDLKRPGTTQAARSEVQQFFGNLR